MNRKSLITKNGPKEWTVWHPTKDASIAHWTCYPTWEAAIGRVYPRKPKPRKPRINKEGKWWLVSYPMDPAAIRANFTTWRGALFAVAIWHRANATRTTPAPPRRQVSNRKKILHIVNHVGIVLDASSSMEDLREQTIKVVDAQIADMAEQSKEKGQETRVTVIVFADEAECIIYEMDVLRLPSIAEFYQPYGNTALVDATILSADALSGIDDLAKAFDRNGDHAFLVCVFTDGQENASGKPKSHINYYWRTPPALIAKLSSKITTLSKDNWTFVCFVPNRAGIEHAVQYGFPRGNVATWDATSEKGIREAGEKMRTTTDSYMTARATGTRSVTNLFDISSAVVNADAILAAGLTRVDYDEYELIPVPPIAPKISDDDWALAHPGKKRKKPLPWGGEIGDFVRKINGGRYEIGKAYFPLTDDRSFIIQPNKEIVIMDTTNSNVYRGSRSAVRKLLKNLPEDQTVRVRPSNSDRFMVYVKSTSDNRSLSPRAPLLLFK